MLKGCENVENELAHESCSVVAFGVGSTESSPSVTRDLHVVSPWPHIGVSYTLKSTTPEKNNTISITPII
jgi:hypothetical protein